MLMTVLFYFFSGILIASAFGVITSKNAVKSVLFLVVSFIATAGLWVLLEVEFLAFLLIVVYVGAVMVLFLFVIMMLDIDKTIKQTQFVAYWPLAAVVGASLVVLLVLTFTPAHFGLKHFPLPPPEPHGYSSIKVLGMSLFTHYIYPFELGGVVLLVAMIAAITLTFRGPRKGSKTQVIKEQLRADPKERITMVDLPKKPKPSLITQKAKAPNLKKPQVNKRRKS